MSRAKMQPMGKKMIYLYSKLGDFCNCDYNSFYTITPTRKMLAWDSANTEYVQRFQKVFSLQKQMNVEKCKGKCKKITDTSLVIFD